jgi:nicotinate dehydrogenase subunit B
MNVPRSPDRGEFLAMSSALLVLSEATKEHAEGELYLVIDAEGDIIAFNGHVDLGTGIRTALAQIVAEELDAPFERVRMVLGDTSVAPNQGPTIASETIQIAAEPLRRAAATARAYLLNQAAERLASRVDDLSVDENGLIRAKASNQSLGFADLVAGRHVRLRIDPSAPLKPTSLYTLVGASRPRVDIPGKATGAWTFIHDVRVPGMLHGRVVRPPYAGFATGAHVGASLIAVDEKSVRDAPGLVAIVVIGDFVGVVARREEQAEAAAERLKVEWRAPPEIPDLEAPEAALRANPSKPRKLLDRGDVDRALAAAMRRIERSYVWPYQMHGSIGPSCAVADVRAGGATVWSGTQNPFPLRADLAVLLDLPETRIVIERYEAAGCYGRNCADDVSADAALLSRAVGAPVRVQLTRLQEHAWEPKGAAQVMDVRGGLDLEGGPAGYDFETRYPSNGAPTLALLLTGKISSAPVASEMGDRTVIPPYLYSHARVTVHDMPPIARASWFRGVSALPNTFAHESFIDELAIAAGVDPIDYRLRYLNDPRAVDLVRAVAERAAWVPHSGPGSHGGSGDILHGRGFAYAVYVHGPFPGKAAAWAAWVADVAVNKATGEIAVTRVVAGQDSGLMINPDGVKHQIHGNVIQSTSRVLKEAVSFSNTAVKSLEWGGYPILTFPELPEIDVLMMPRQDEPPLGAGESASVPSAAAIANAVFDATGVRFRELPLTPERVRAALNPLPAPPPAPPAQPKPRWPRFGFSLAGLLAGAYAILTTATPWPAAIAPIARPSADVFSSLTIERGRLAAAAGACNVCHAGSNGENFAGGRALETPFGLVYATNVTPDVETGVGAWSYPAFARAMTDGVSRDGHHLYPAHPYPSFARADEADIQALYAYLMVQTPVRTMTPKTRLAFPFNLRPLMSVWNALFLRTSPAIDDPARGAEGNRGAYLVETLGHCGACHSPRNAFGAEKTGEWRLAGGDAEGWDAPALTAASPAPVAWNAGALFTYLRGGRPEHHGAAAGPMAEVVGALKPLPDADIRAIAAYLTSLDPRAPSEAEAELSARRTLEAGAAAETAARLAEPRGSRLFDGACASCHEGASDLTSLALNSNLHGARPDNVVQAVLSGVAAPHTARDSAIAAMPAFATAFEDDQLADLARYLRRRFAQARPAWEDLPTAIRRARSATATRDPLRERQ